jgi:2-amino-4-hydroxy-6-hydroxymethyldihydropteridine diphosphokinase
MAIDDLVIETPSLQVPHPHLHERDFFILPLQQLAPGWRHPVTGLTPAQMLEK